jgi:hypothetical protein
MLRSLNRASIFNTHLLHATVQKDCEMTKMQILLLAIMIIACNNQVQGQAYAAGRVVVYFYDDVQETEAAELIESFGLTYYRTNTVLLPTRYFVNVPCEYEIEWVNVFSNIINVDHANIDQIISVPEGPTPEPGPHGLEGCSLLAHEATFDQSTLELQVLTVVLDDGRRFRITLEPPYNVKSIDRK